MDFFVVCLRVYVLITSSDVEERLSSGTGVMYQYTSDIADHLKVVSEVLLRNLETLAKNSLLEGGGGTERQLCFFIESLLPWLLSGDHELQTMHIGKAVQFRRRFSQFNCISFDPVRVVVCESEGGLSASARGSG